MWPALICHYQAQSTAPEESPITFAVKVRIVFTIALLGLCGCEPNSVAGGAAGQRSAPTIGPASLYRAPPTATAAILVSADVVGLVGHSERGDRVRLASPGGQAAFATAGRDGAWRIDLPATAAPRLFGLAVVDRGRTIQSEGYIAVMPGGGAAQLRAGAGAVVLGPKGGEPMILAVDFDSKGGAVVSGRASSRAAVEVWVDGVRRSRGQTSSDGQFSLALNEPVAFGEHRFEVTDGPRRAAAQVALSLAPPLSTGPYRSRRARFGWRVDWMTPGGGLQTTLLLGQDGVTA